MEVNDSGAGLIVPLRLFQIEPAQATLRRPAVRNLPLTGEWTARSLSG